MRLAHLSDLHLLSLAGVRWLEFTNKRWLGGLNLLRSRGRRHHTHVFQAMVEDINSQALDHVVCTGDITNLGLKAEFRFARTCFDALALGPDNVTVIPGNHDTYVAEAASHFDAFFADYYRPDPGWGGRDAGTCAPLWPAVRVRGPVAIIGLCSCLPTPWFTAYGRLDRAQVARLRRVLASDTLAGKLRLIAIHHPPAGKVARHRGRGLRDWRVLAEVLAESGAELVLHGHEHRDLRHEIPGPGSAIPVMGIQSGSYFGVHPEHTARYRIFHVSSRDTTPGGRPRVVAHELRVWDPGRGAFVEDPGSGTRPVPAPARSVSP